MLVILIGGGGVAQFARADQGLPRSKLVMLLVSRVVRHLVLVLMTFLTRRLTTRLTTLLTTSVACDAGND